MSAEADLTAIVVNFKTPHLLPIVTDSFKEAYPLVRLILVDNGSGDTSCEVISELQEKHGAVDSIFLDCNVYRGPAVNLALEKVSTPHFFLLDSDCRVKHGGFLEKMLEHFQQPEVYAVGKLRYVAPTGVPVRLQKYHKRYHTAIPYAETWGALFDREKCAELGKFVVAGASGIEIAKAAQERRWEAVDFPMPHYVDHLGAGTRRMFRGSFRPKPGEEASEWTKGGRRF